MNLSLLKEICETPGTPGREQRIRQVVMREVTPLADECHVDNLGSVVALKRGRNNSDGKKVMVAAHLDEIGFIVTHVDDQGFVHFHTLGGFDPKTLTAQRVIVHGREDLLGVMSSKPVHVMTAEERQKMPKTTDYFVDLGLPADRVKERVRVGDHISRERSLIELGDCVSGKSIDNRVSVFILIEALRQLDAVPYDVYAVFTVQEEVGIRGASVAAHTIDPDFGIALDTTVAYDLPGAADKEKITRLGAGAAVKVMDASAIADYRMIEFLQQTAERHEVPWQPEILTAGGTDTAGLQRMGKRGAIAGAISVPTRHLHQTTEMAHRGDITHATDLLRHALAELNQFDWAHR